MSKSEELINLLADKIELLITRHNKVVKELENAKSELNDISTQNDNLKAQISEKDREIDSLENTLGALKESSVGVSEKFEDKVNQLVDEIDECISLLKEG